MTKSAIEWFFIFPPYFYTWQNTKTRHHIFSLKKCSSVRPSTSCCL